MAGINPAMAYFFAGKSIHLRGIPHNNCNLAECTKGSLCEGAGREAD